MTNEFRAMCAELVELCTPVDSIPQLAERLQKLNALADRARALLAQPVAEGPTDEDLLQVAIDTRLYRFQATVGDPVQYELTEAQINAYARAVLSRWGRPTPQPVPTSERLPGPDDCDAEGLCWWLTRSYPPGAVFWELSRYSLASTHWLPANALPTPEVTNG